MDGVVLFYKIQKTVFEKDAERFNPLLVFQPCVSAHLCPRATVATLVCQGLWLTLIPPFQKGCIICINATRDKPLSINTL